MNKQLLFQPTLVLPACKCLVPSPGSGAAGRYPHQFAFVIGVEVRSRRMLIPISPSPALPSTTAPESPPEPPPVGPPRPPVPLGPVQEACLGLGAVAGPVVGAGLFMLAGFKGPYLFAGAALLLTLPLVRPAIPAAGREAKAEAGAGAGAATEDFADAGVSGAGDGISWRVFLRRYGVTAIICCSVVSSLALDFTGGAQLHRTTAPPPHRLAFAPMLPRFLAAARVPVESGASDLCKPCVRLTRDVSDSSHL